MNVKNWQCARQKNLGIEVKTVVANDDCASAPKMKSKNAAVLPEKF